MKVPNIKLEIMLQIFVRKYLFEQWVRKLFYLNNNLNKEYDSIYQDQYYILIYNLLTEGKSHIVQVMESIKESDNKYIIEFYDKLYKAILEMESSLNEDENFYLEYRRHGACHIFQDQYEIIQENGKIKEKRKNISLVKLHQSLENVINKYEGDNGFDLYLNKLFYPILSKLYSELTNIHLAESKDHNV